MKSYKIDICEYYGKTVEIKAETEEEALKKHAEDEETNRFNNIKYYLNEIKRNVKESSLLIKEDVNHHVNKALNKLMCRIIKTVMNYQN